MSKSKPLTNIALAHKLIAQLYLLGVEEWIVCAGSRNAPLIKALKLYQGEEALNDKDANTNEVSSAGGGSAGLIGKGCAPLRITYFFEERSAGFFAIGRAKISGGPIAVLTTSGTAVAELLPAMMEASYSGISLVMISADRPSSHWGTGAPQTVWQPGIFTRYSSPTICWDCNQQPAINRITDAFGNGAVGLADNFPSHINVSFEEPLLDAPVETGYVRLADLRGESARAVGNLCAGGSLIGGYGADGSAEASELIVRFCDSSCSPLVLLSALTPAEATQVKPHLLHWGLPIYAEAHSQLREDSELGSLIIRCGEELFNQRQRVAGSAVAGREAPVGAEGLYVEELFDSVIRIGGIPTTRLWRNLESSLGHWPVISFSNLPFSGLARTTDKPLPLAALESLSSVRRWSDVGGQNSDFRVSSLGKCSINRDILSYHVPKSRYYVPGAKIGRVTMGLSDLLAQFSDSEPGWIRRVSRVIPKGSMVFLGNSLPIREWDLAAEYPQISSLSGQNNAQALREQAYYPKDYTVLGNRGVNGIDGLVSTFLGAAQPGRDNWLILGDLSAAYDLAGLGLIDNLPHPIIRIVLINNGGGMIFNRLYKDPSFENRHQISFKPWAEMFGLDYRRNEELESPNLPQQTLIEITPNPETTTNFWNSYEQLFKS